MDRMDTRTIGEEIENEAYRFLLNQNYQLLTRNFHCKFGEIDLIIKSPEEEIVSVEVRYRKNDAFGGATYSITSAKQRKIIKSAAYYLHTYNLSDSPCRFDVITLEPNNHGKNLEWITDAFQV